MAKKISSILDLRYQLVQGAPPCCVPDPVYPDLRMGLVYLKTNQNISLAYGNYVDVHTGIAMIDFPELLLNTEPPISIALIARFYSIPEMEEEDGIKLIAPKIRTIEDDDEIILTIHNTHKDIFNARKGSRIALMELDFLPKADFLLAGV